EQVPPAGKLLADLELLIADAHEFRELRLLSALRSGRVNLPREHAIDAKQLLGGSGTSVGERLGMSPEASAAATWEAARSGAACARTPPAGRNSPPAARGGAGGGAARRDWAGPPLPRLSPPAAPPPRFADPAGRYEARL